MAPHIRFMNQRREQILSILTERERVTVNELTELLSVSSVTVRSDLNHLAEEGHIVRVHGGAALARPGSRSEVSFAARRRLRASEKRMIGKLAATLIEPVDVVFLDASSTALAVGQAIKESSHVTDLTVLTTGLWTAVELMGLANIHVMLTGGSVHPTSGSITGSIAREILSRFKVNKAFIGAWGITLDYGLTESNLLEVEIKETVIRAASEVIAVVDGSKFGQTGLISFAQIDQLNFVVTDSSAPNDVICALRDRQISVLIAGTDEMTAQWMEAVQ